MSDSIGASFESDNQPDSNEWKTVLILLPRFSYFISRAGMRRTFLMPGQYEVRRSRSFNALVYRTKR